MTKKVHKRSIMKKEYRNSTRTKKMIRAAFAELIGEKKIISNISVAELSERADIAKSTFYNHYEDIYAVADEMYRELIESLNDAIDAMESDTSGDYKLYLERIFDFIEENEDLYRKVINSPEAVFFIDKVKYVVSKRAFANKSFFEDVKMKPIRMVQVQFLTNACVDTMVDYFRGNIDMEFDDFKRFVLEFIDRMI